MYINTKRFGAKHLVGRGLRLKRRSPLGETPPSFIIPLTVLAVCASAIVFVVVRDRAPMKNLNGSPEQKLNVLPERNLNVSPNCLPVTEPLAISEAKKASYFPVAIFDDGTHMGRVKDKTFPTSLMFMGEPSFLTLPQCADEAYRFLWIRAFRRPVAVRVWKSDREFYLVAKKLDKEGYLQDVRYRAMTAGEWARLQSHLERASFWSLANNDPTIGTDGGFWIVEGVRDRQYHVVERWSPPVGDEYGAIGNYLANLSGIETEDR